MVKFKLLQSLEQCDVRSCNKFWVDGVCGCSFTGQNIKQIIVSDILIWSAELITLSFPVLKINIILKTDFAGFSIEVYGKTGNSDIKNFSHDSLYQQFSSHF